MPTPRRSRAKRGDGPTVHGKLERHERWAGLRKGDVVEVADLGQRGASYAFQAYVLNTETGESWVEVVGGASGDRKVRSFDPTRIYPEGGLKGASRRPSLAEAPRFDI